MVWHSVTADRRAAINLLTVVEDLLVFRALGSAVLAAVFGLSGLATGTAAAASSCADYHWIGAAGSGQRDGVALAANGGMGDVVYQSYLQLRSELLASGRSIDAESVQYPPPRCRSRAA